MQTHTGKDDNGNAKKVAKKVWATIKKNAVLFLLMAILMIAAIPAISSYFSQSEIYAEAYEEARAEGRDETATKMYAAAYEGEYERAIKIYKDKGIAKPIATSYALYCLNRIAEGHTETYAKTYAREAIDMGLKSGDIVFAERFARERAEGKSYYVAKAHAEAYRQAYQDAYEYTKSYHWSDEKARAYATLYADALQEATAEGKDEMAAKGFALSYALKRIQGHSHVYAKSYVEAYQDGRRVQGMNDSTAKAHAEAVVRQASKQEK